jgi:hypothetical protein
MKGHVLAATEYIYGDEDEIIKVEDWIGQIRIVFRTLIIMLLY